MHRICFLLFYTSLLTSLVHRICFLLFYTCFPTFLGVQNLISSSLHLLIAFRWCTKLDFFFSTPVFHLPLVHRTWFLLLYTCLPTFLGAQNLISSFLHLFTRFPWCTEFDFFFSTPLYSLSLVHRIWFLLFYTCFPSFLGAQNLISSFLHLLFIQVTVLPAFSSSVQYFQVLFYCTTNNSFLRTVLPSPILLYY